MSRLAISQGARPETLSGLAGLGDLVLTCTGSLSRNRKLGIELLKGRALPEILSSMHGVAEGVGSAAALLALAQQQHIDLPITEQVDAILLLDLLLRPDLVVHICLPDQARIELPLPPTTVPVVSILA